MSRRQRSAPKANVSPSVRLGLASLVEGNEEHICSMLDASASDDLVEKLVACMGVGNLSAEMLLANYFSAPILSRYAALLGKSGKGGTASLAARIAGEWAKPSFTPPPSTSSSSLKRPAEEADAEEAEGASKQSKQEPSEAPPPAASSGAKAETEAAAAQEEEEEPPFPLLPITSAATLANIRAIDADEKTVFIASYPKSGTTWLQNIVYQVPCALKPRTRRPGPRLSRSG